MTSLFNYLKSANNPPFDLGSLSLVSKPEHQNPQSGSSAHAFIPCYHWMGDGLGQDNPYVFHWGHRGNLPQGTKVVGREGEAGTRIRFFKHRGMTEISHTFCHESKKNVFNFKVWLETHTYIPPTYKHVSETWKANVNVKCQLNYHMWFVVVILHLI